MRAVIDTDVLVSAALNPVGAPGRVIDAVRNQDIVPVVSSTILAEYAEVLLRPHFGFPSARVEELLSDFRDLALLIEPAIVELNALPDPLDAPFIFAARFAACPIITGNARRSPPEAGVEVSSPGEWLGRLAGI